MSLPQYLNIFNQPSSTILPEGQVNTESVDQQKSALSSGMEQDSTVVDTELNEASISVNDQGVLFSSYLRHLMPLLTQETTISQDVSNVDSNITVEVRSLS